MIVYERTPFYYETDQMHIIHHSNYIRWFEEARVEYLNAVGIRFADQEDRGIVCPVLTVESTYRKMVRFGDTVQIFTRLSFYKGIRYGFSYEVRNKETGELCCTGSSTHCFLNPEGKPMRIRREYPEMHEALTKHLAEDEALAHPEGF